MRPISSIQGTDNTPPSTNPLRGGLAGDLYGMLFKLNAVLASIAGNNTQIAKDQANLQMTETRSAAQATINSATQQSNATIAKAVVSGATAAISVGRIGYTKFSSEMKELQTQSTAAKTKLNAAEGDILKKENGDHLKIDMKKETPEQLSAEKQNTIAQRTGGAPSTNPKENEATAENADNGQIEKANKLTRERIKGAQEEYSGAENELTRKDGNIRMWEQLAKEVAQTIGSGVEASFQSQGGLSDANNKIASTVAQTAGGNADSARQSVNQFYSKIAELIQAISRAAQAAPAA